MRDHEHHGPLDERTTGSTAGRDLEAIAGPGRALPVDTREALQICPACDGRLVYPQHWYEWDETNWHVFLRCPDCEWQGGGVYSQETLEWFDLELERATLSMIDSLRLIVSINHADELDRFSAALAADAILPEDF